MCAVFSSQTVLLIPTSYFFPFNFIGVSLTHKVVLVSGVQQSKSVISVYIYIHTHMYIYIYTHTHIHTHIHIYTHTYAYIYTHIYMFLFRFFSHIG